MEGKASYLDGARKSKRMNVFHSWAREERLRGEWGGMRELPLERDVSEVVLRTEPYSQSEHLEMKLGAWG